MRIRIVEIVTQEAEVEVEDGLTGDELQEAVQIAKDQYDGSYAFLQIDDWTWSKAE